MQCFPLVRCRAADALAKSQSRSRIRGLIVHLRQSPACEIVSASRELFDKALPVHRLAGFAGIFQANDFREWFLDAHLAGLLQELSGKIRGHFFSEPIRVGTAEGGGNGLEPICPVGAREHVAVLLDPPLPPALMAQISQKLVRPAKRNASPST